MLVSGSVCFFNQTVFFSVFFFGWVFPTFFVWPLKRRKGGLFTGSRDCCVMCGIPRRTHEFRRIRGGAAQVPSLKLT